MKEKIGIGWSLSSLVERSSQLSNKLSFGTVSIVLAYHKQNSLVLGLIRAFISLS